MKKALLIALTLLFTYSNIEIAIKEIQQLDMKKVLLLAIIFTSAKLHSQSEGGFISDYQKILDTQQQQNKKISSSILANRNRLNDLSGAKEAKINPIFLRNIMLFSHRRYLDLVAHDECLFYSLLDTQVLQTAEGPIQNLLVDVLDNFGQWSTTLLPKDLFFNYLYRQKKCQRNQILAREFSRAELVKTLKTVNWKSPETEEQCTQVWKAWQKDPRLPYLCNISETIEWGKKAEKSLAQESLGPNKTKQLKALVDHKKFLMQALGLGERTYTTNLCRNIDSLDNFCSLYLQNDVWSKIIKEDKNRWKMSYTCQRFIPSSDDPLNTFSRCREMMTKRPVICATSLDAKYPALYPRAKCDQISDALNRGHLITQYQDCPGKIDNEAITNTFRIYNHFYAREEKQVNNRDCSSKVNETFARLVMLGGNEKAWPLEICYTDRIDRKKVCIPFVPLLDSDSDLAEAKVLAKILEKTHGASSKLKCHFIEKSQFQPALLQYKSGCYVLSQKNNCTSLHCPKELRYNGLIVDDITYQGTPTFDYFVNNYGTGTYSIASILEEKFKIESTKLTNLTEIRFFLNLSPTAIIHGIGCAEALYPHLFPKRNFNQCSPLPFIIDGLVDATEGKGNVSLRSSIEDIHHPYLIDWKNVFNAVASYRNIHPNQLWALYGIKK